VEYQARAEDKPRPIELAAVVEEVRSLCAG